MDLELSERLVIVTGARQGIGRAIAEGFAREGARVLLVDRDDSVTGVALELDARAMTCDLANPSAADEVASLAAELGGAEILINNAGISRPAPVEAMTDEEWEAVLDVNASAPFRLMRALWPQLARNDGAIINLASFAAKRSTLFGGNASYVASKHAIVGLTRAAAFEGAKQGIRINAIAPGIVNTDMVKLHDAATREKIAGKIPQGRFAEPSEIADLALFLASGRARHICGEVVNINGGLLMD